MLSTLIGSRKLAVKFLQDGIIEGVPTEMIINFCMLISILPYLLSVYTHTQQQ